MFVKAEVERDTQDLYLIWLKEDKYFALNVVT